MADNPTDPEISNTAPGRMPGRWTARVALLMSVVAATLAGYLSYTLIYLRPIAAQEYKTQQAIEVLEQRVLAEMDTALLETQRVLADLTLDLREENRDVQSTLENAVAQSMAEARANKPTTPRQWRMAEAAFLLRMANHWLQFEGDINASVTALQRADEVLLAIQAGGKKDEYDLLPVRSALAQEVVALKSVQRVDVQGIYLRLGALAQSVPSVRSGLTLETPEEATIAAQAPSTLMVIADELEKFVRITDLSTLTTQGGDVSTSERDLGPAEMLAARRTVIAALERAQLAVLRGQDDTYQLSLEQAQAAAKRLAPASDPQLRSFLGQISGLADEPLNTPLPKITGSLDALSQLMESL